MKISSQTSVQIFQDDAVVGEYQVIHHNTICLKNRVVRTGGLAVKRSRLPQVFLYAYIFST